MKTKSLSRLVGLPIFLILFAAQIQLHAQVVTVTDDDAYTPDNSAMLDVKSTDKGLLIPRLDSLQRVTISTPATGLLVFDTDANAFFYYDGTDWLNLTTNVISPSSATVNDVLFSVINTNGDTVFAVYPEGVEINVGDGVGKANKGGFAVGGLASGKAGQNQFLVVSPDSVRIYIDTTTGTKANKGGFAVGGLASGKALGPTLFTVSDDSIRIYIDENSGKANKGGFAVGGLASGKASTDEFLRVTTDSTRIYTSDADKGFGIRDLSGGTAQNYLDITPDNIFIGQESGVVNEGEHNVFVGYQTGYNNVGNTSGIGSKNNFIGYQAGYNNTTGSNNMFFGKGSGFKNTTGFNNTFIGTFSGYDNIIGQDNVFIGPSSGLHFEDGFRNTFIGMYSGAAAGTVSDCVFLGYEAGRSETNSNRLYIANSDVSKYNALIYGEFDTPLIKLNATVEIKEVMKLAPQSSAPAGSLGSLYVNINGTLYFHDGTGWYAVQVSAK